MRGQAPSNFRTALQKSSRSGLNRDLNFLNAAPRLEDAASGPIRPAPAAPWEWGAIDTRSQGLAGAVGIYLERQTEQGGERDDEIGRHLQRAS
jgi:hypothetical protein